ncbi:uncharacterized [Tachysurus ichikawai]
MIVCDLQLLTLETTSEMPGSSTKIIRHFSHTDLALHVLQEIQEISAQLHTLSKSRRRHGRSNLAVKCMKCGVLRNSALCLILSGRGGRLRSCRIRQEIRQGFMSEIFGSCLQSGQM